MSPSVSTPLPLTVRVEDLEGGASTEHVFKKSPVRVGRNALNELTLAAPFVSLSHAVLRFDGDRTEVIDLGSTNGVLVDGKRIESNVPVPVTVDSDVRIGALRLHFGRSLTEMAPAAREQTHFRRATEEIRLTPGPQGLKLPPGMRIPAARTMMAPAAAPFALASPVTPAPAPVRGTGAGPPPAPEGAPATGTELPRVTVVKLKSPAAETAPAPAPPPADLALQSSVDAIYPLYVEYRQAWRKVHEAMLSRATGLGPEERTRLGALLEAKMPAVYQEEQFRALTGDPASSGDAATRVRAAPAPALSVPSAAPGPGAVSPPSAEQRGLLQVFARTYAGGAELSSDAQLERLLERVSEVLEAFGTAFLELRKGQAEFGEGIAVRTVTSDTPLRKARSAQELLRLLLDPGADGPARIDDLTGGFGEVMIHQVAMLGATRRGIRAMLDRLDPKKLQSQLPFPSRLWQRWERLESAWSALAEEEHAVQVVFGPEFARSYAMVMGGHAPGGTGSGKTPKPKGGPA